MPLFDPSALAAVSPEEIAFAITLFMGVASGQIAVETGLRKKTAGSECGRILRALSSGLQVKHGDLEDVQEISLGRAFATLWCHYALDGRRLSLCARVLAFYFLAQRNGGRILGEWASESIDTPENVLLHPALVEAVAVVPLMADGHLCESLFFETVASIAGLSNKQI